MGFCTAAVSARYFYRAEFVFEFYDLEQAVWIEICCLLCGLGAGDPGVEGLASESLTLQCLASQRVYSLFPGLFPCAIRSLAVASACSAHIPISKLTAAATDSLSLVWAKTSPSAPKSQPSCGFPHSTQTLQPCLTPAPSCKSRKWNFLPFFPPCNPQFLVCAVSQPEITVPNLPRYLQLRKPFLILFSAGGISQMESKEMLKLAKGRAQQAFVACWLNL